MAEKLPQDLQDILLAVIKEESAATRTLTRQQHDTQVAKAKEAGVEFTKLSDEDLEELKKMAEPVLQKWGKKIGPDYLDLVRQKLGQ